MELMVPSMSAVESMAVDDENFIVKLSVHILVPFNKTKFSRATCSASVASLYFFPVI